MSLMVRSAPPCVSCMLVLAFSIQRKMQCSGKATNNDVLKLNDRYEAKSSK
jgi:hypothetical protein